MVPDRREQLQLVFSLTGEEGPKHIISHERKIEIGGTHRSVLASSIRRTVPKDRHRHLW
jgi:hypothetical protein